jgi:predicted transposase/invertase (TIGR01784 family)
MHPEHKKEIRVIPIVVYHGLDEREIPQDTASIYDPIDNDYRYIQNFYFELFNISILPDHQIKGIPLLRIGLYVLKYIQRPELLNKIDDILEIFKELPDDQMRVNLDIVGRYIENAAHPKIRHQVVRKIIDWFNQGDRKVSRILEILQRQGMKKGMEKGIEKGIEKGKKIGKIDDAQRMILRGIDLKLIQEVTSLSMERLTEIREKIDLARKQFLQDIEIREIQKTTGLSMEILEEIKRLK